MAEEFAPFLTGALVKKLPTRAKFKDKSKETAIATGTTTY